MGRAPSCGSNKSGWVAKHRRIPGTRDLPKSVRNLVLRRSTSGGGPRSLSMNSRKRCCKRRTHFRRDVTTADVEAARSRGATDIEIHDTVLIAAAFCMYNRYVDGLDTLAASRGRVVSRTRQEDCAGGLCCHEPGISPGSSCASKVNSKLLFAAVPR
jgi:hypothetical protein